MAETTNIEWTDATWNPVRARNLNTGKTGWHCVHVSDGCKNCYAEKRNRWIGTGLAYKPGHEKDIELYLDEKALTAPLHWTRPRMIFPGSMTDLFAGFVRDEWLDRIFAVMALTPQHTYQLLTKRPERARDYMTSRAEIAELPGRRGAVISRVVDILEASRVTDLPRHLSPFPWPLRNVWLGVSAENQQTADARIPILLDTPAAVRWLSAEPLIGEINLNRVPGGSFRQSTTVFGAMTNQGWHQTGLNWVVAGGESQPGSRPAHPDWFRKIRDQCAAAGVPFLFKQWGDWRPPFERTSRVTEVSGSEIAHTAWPDGTIAHGSAKEHGGAGLMLARVGKRAAGRLLDGVLHDGYPAPSERNRVPANSASALAEAKPK
jgi:protein gp37